MTDRSAAFSSPGRLVVGTSSKDRITVQRLVPTRPTFLIGCAFALLALLPLLGPGSWSWPRIGLAVVLGSISAALVRSGRPRRRTAWEVRLDLGWMTDGANVRRLRDAHRITLDGSVVTADGTPELRYRADLDLLGGPRIVLLEQEDPARLLRDLAQIVRFWRIPVEPGWGLAAGSKPWGDEPESHRTADAAARRIPVDVKLSESRSARGSGITALVFGAAMGVGFWLMLRSRLRLGAPVTTLGYSLPAAATTVMLLVGAALVTRHWRVHSNGDIRIETRVLGLPIAARSVPRRAVRRAQLISPDENEPRHLLLETDEGPLCVPCAPESGDLLLRAVRRAL